jgi:hypothetical protein
MSADPTVSAPPRLNPDRRDAIIRAFFDYSFGAGNPPNEDGSPVDYTWDCLTEGEQELVTREEFAALMTYFNLPPTADDPIVCKHGVGVDAFCGECVEPPARDEQ